MQLQATEQLLKSEENDVVQRAKAAITLLENAHAKERHRLELQLNDAFASLKLLVIIVSYACSKTLKQQVTECMFLLCSYRVALAPG